MLKERDTDRQTNTSTKRSIACMTFRQTARSLDLHAAPHTGRIARTDLLTQFSVRPRSCCCLLFVGCLLACLTSQQHASVSQGRIRSILRAATLRYKLQTTLSTSPRHSLLTQGRPVPALTLLRHAPGRVATGVPVFMTRPREKSRRKRDSNPGSSALEADALTTGPRRRCCGPSLLSPPVTLYHTVPCPALTSPRSVRHVSRLAGRPLHCQSASYRYASAGN